LANPGVTVSLSAEGSSQAVQSIANRIHVIGPGSAGPLNTPVAKTRLSNLAVNGYGPGPSLAAEVISAAQSNPVESGLPVYYTRSATSTPSTLGTITKAPKTLGTAVSAFGQIKLAGADANGDLYWLALQAGVSLTVQVGGALGYAIVNKAVALTIPLATTANAVKAYWDGIPALLALATIDPQGTGLSNAGTVLATTLFDAGLLTFTGLDNGYSVEIIVAGNNTALSNSYTGVDSKTLTINLATDATGEATSTANAVLADIELEIVGKISATSGGTGLAGPKTVTALPFGSSAAVTGSGTPTDRYLVQVKCVRSGALGAAGVKFALDEVNPESRTVFGVGNSSLWFLAKRVGLSVKFVQQTGASKDLTHTFASGLLTVNLGTSGASAPNTTASALRTYLALYPQVAAAFRFNLEVGDGSGVLVASDEVLLTDPSLSWSSEKLVPVSGVVSVSDSKIDSGISLTFTGTLEADDLWVAESTLPSSSTADMLTALAAVTADSVNRGATVVFASSFDRAGALLLDTPIQAALQTRQMSAFFNVRGIGEGVANEPHDTWQASITSTWIGFVSDKGALLGIAGEYLHADSLTGRTMRRYLIWGAAGRKSAAPYHQDLGKRAADTGSGALPRCLGLYHDEDKTPGLGDQRFLTATSMIQRPGQRYITESPTMADANDDGYTLHEWRATVLVGVRVVFDAVPEILLGSYPSIKEADETGAPIGALTIPAANDLESYLGALVWGEWTRRKSDGQPSVGELPQGVKPVEVLRTNNYVSDRTIYYKVNCPVTIPARFISIEGVVQL